MSNKDRLLSNNQKILNNNSNISRIITRIQQIPTPEILDEELNQQTEKIEEQNDIILDINEALENVEPEKRLQDKEIEITQNGTTSVAPDEGYDGMRIVQINTNVSGGGGTTEKEFTGHYDTQGLKTIGWSDEEIQYYQDNGVVWNAENDDDFKLNNDELLETDGFTTRFLPKSSKIIKFNNYYCLLAIPVINLGSTTNMTQTFYSCYSLTTIPLLNTSNVTNMTSMFYYCYSLKTIPLIDTSNVTSMSNMFDSCYSLKTIPLLDTSKATKTDFMFQTCYSLKIIPLLDTSNVTNMNGMFSNCRSLAEIPSLDTSNVTNVSNMFANCFSLKKINLLDFQSVINIKSTFNNCNSLTYIDGFKDLGKAYSTSSSASYANYTLNLSASNSITHDSLMNIINNLYDIKTKGCNNQLFQIGTTNKAKLTEEEIAIATNKGWLVT